MCNTDFDQFSTKSGGPVFLYPFKISGFFLFVCLFVVVVVVVVVCLFVCFSTSESFDIYLIQLSMP